jgi:2-polyprenyl-6-methoxyphenol hydroxylase-like FAD-dependent oxidoreductase
VAVKVVLISGAGIAGPTLAYWLDTHGFAPVLVESAPKLREGGYLIDFWGIGYDVAERMGLIPALQALGYLNDQVVFVDAAGRRRSGFGGQVLRRLLNDRFLSIQRGDLARLIFQQIGDKIETLFGDEIAALESDNVGVSVRLASGRTRRVDLVVGADGLHSRVRAAAFGDYASFEHFLGYYVAAFVTDGYSHRDERTYLSYASPGRQVSRFALRDGKTGFLFVFRRKKSDLELFGDPCAQKRLLGEIYSSVRWWEWPEIRDHLAACSDLYFDAVAQVRMPRWSCGRVALVGDAAHCPSLLAGEGAALSMAGACILAGELAKHGDDYAAAFRSYESGFRPFIERKQRSAARFASSFTPKTKFGLFVRDTVLNLARIPVLAKWLFSGFLADDFELSRYPSGPLL